MTRLLFFAFLLPLAEAYRCINFYGLETEAQSLVCSWKHEPGWYLQKAKDVINIDSIRLPFSYEYVASSDMEEMDCFIQSANELGLLVILDYHRGFKDHQGFSPIEGSITYEIWIETLVQVLDRYQNQDNVKAITLFNEYQGKDVLYWGQLLINTADYLETIFPRRYTYMLSCVDWGKNCTDLFELSPFPHNLMVEVHVYGFTHWTQDNYKDSFPSKIPVGGIFVGEIGWRKYEIQNWFQNFRAFSRQKRLVHFCLWTVAHSSDTDNLFEDDCETINMDMANAFNSLFDKAKCLRDVKP